MSPANYTQSELYGDYLNGEETNNEPKTILHVAMGILGFLSISGMIGNAMVLYVFSRQRQKLSSSIFILTLAGTDFITSLITMPYTIALESVDFKVDFDIVCRLYHFLVTTTIPFSAFVMVAIAVDRYLCIVHPFKHTMTIKRAKILVIVLAILATSFGLLSCSMYGVYVRREYFHFEMPRWANLTSEESALFQNSSLFFGHIDSGFGLNETLDRILDNRTTEIEYNIGKCHRNNLIFSVSFFNVFRHVYSSLYGICAVIVIVLYAIIYRSVLVRRRRRFHLSNSCCGILSPPRGMEHEHEQTEFTSLNSTREKSPTALRGSQEEPLNGQNDKNGNTTANPSGGSNGADKDALVRPSGVSRAKLEKLRMANIKTALMLSIVAFTYIVFFMPAWLMAFKTIPMNPIVYYMYFTYNVTNPIIYAFLNQSFRCHLQSIFVCKN